MKYFIFFVLLLSGAIAYDDCEDEEYYRRLDALRPEDPCSREGGICTFAADCPQLTEESGLCPSQRSLGVECCRGVSVRDTRCKKNGGECKKTDRCRPQFDRATDCPANTKCCILI